MAYSRKILQDEKIRSDVEQELKGRKWSMKLRTVTSAYVFFEHPDFPDHVFCSTSIIPSRPLRVGDTMTVEVELAYDRARDCYGYVARSAFRPQDDLNSREHKSEFENLAAVIQKLVSKSETVEDEGSWHELLPTGWNWSLEFTRGHVKMLRFLISKLTQCGSLMRLHGMPKRQTVYEIREVLSDYREELHALEERFERILSTLQSDESHQNDNRWERRSAYHRREEQN